MNSNYKRSYNPNLTLGQVTKINSMRNNNYSEEEIDNFIKQETYQNYIDNNVKQYYQNNGIPVDTSQSYFSQNVESIDNSDTLEQLPSVKGNFFETFGDTALDVLGNLLGGATKGIEGIVDSVAGGVAFVGDIFGADTSNIQDFVEKDIVGSTKAFNNGTETFWEMLDNSTQHSLLNMGKAGEIIEEVSRGVGGMLPSIGASLLSGGTLGMPVMIASAIGGATEEGLASGADIKNAFAYGVTSGAIEGLTEKMLGGFGSIAKKGFLDKPLSKITSNALGKVIVGTIGEGAEEVLSDIFNPLAKYVTGVSDTIDMPTAQDLAETFLVGGLCSLVIGGGQYVMNKALPQKTQDNIKKVQEDFNKLDEDVKNDIKETYNEYKEQEDIVKSKVDDGSIVKEDIDELDIRAKLTEDIIETELDYVLKEEDFQNNTEENGSQLPKNDTQVIDNNTQNVTIDNINEVNASKNATNVNVNVDNNTQNNTQEVGNQLPKNDKRSRVITRPTEENLKSLTRKQVEVFVRSEERKMQRKYNTKKPNFKNFFEYYEKNIKTLPESVRKRVKAQYQRLYDLYDTFKGDKEDFYNRMNNIYKGVENVKSKVEYKAFLEIQMQHYAEGSAVNLLFSRDVSNLNKRQLDTLNSIREILGVNDLMKQRELDLHNAKLGVNARDGVRSKSFKDFSNWFSKDKLKKLNMTPAEISRVAELAVNKAPVNNAYDRDLLNDFYVKADLVKKVESTHGKHRTNEGNYMLVFDEKTMPYYMKEINRQAKKKIGTTLTFVAESFKSRTTCGFFIPATKQLFISNTSGIVIENVINHEIGHFFVDKSLDNYKKFVDLMDRLESWSVDTGGNEKGIMFTKMFEHLNSRGYRNLRRFGFDCGSIAELKSKLDKMTNEEFLRQRGNSKLEEAFCELVGNDYRTINDIISDFMKVEIENFKTLNDSFIEYKGDDYQYKGTDDVLFEGIDKNAKVKFLDMSDIDTTTKVKPYNEEVKPTEITPTNTKELVEKVKKTSFEKGRKLWMEFQLAFINSFQGLENAISKMTNGKVDFSKDSTWVRSYNSRTSNFLQNGIMIDGQRVSVGFKELTAFIDKKYPPLTKGRENAHYKQLFFDYMLHKNNIDRMNILNGKGAYISNIETKSLTKAEKSALDTYIKQNTMPSLDENGNAIVNKKGQVVYEEPVMIPFDKLNTIFEEQTVELIKGQYRQFKSTFGKYLKFDILPSNVKERLKADFPTVYDFLEKNGEVSEGDFDRLEGISREVITKVSGSEIKTRVETAKSIIGKYFTEISSQDSMARVKEYEKTYPEFISESHKFYEFSDGILQLQVRNGLISEEAYHEIKQQYPHYVPTDREYIGTSSSTILQDAKGSDRLIEPLDVALARKLQQTNKRIAYNTCAKSLYDAMKGNIEGSKEFVQHDHEVRRTSTQQAFELLEEGDLVYDKKSSVINFRDNGLDVSLRVNSDVYQAFAALTNNNVMFGGNVVSKTLQTSMKVFRRLVTDLNPFFIVRNFSRDIQDAIFYSSNTKEFFKNIGKAYKSIWANSEVWQLYCSMGGLHSSMFDYAKGMIDVDLPASMTDKQFKMHERRKKVTSIADKIAFMNLLVEQAPRLAEFMATIEGAKSQGLDINESVYRDAFNNAQEVTVNFGRNGKYGKMLNTYYVPFLNAQIQGFDKLRRVVVKGGKGVIDARTNGVQSLKPMANLVSKCAIMGIAPMIFNALMYNDDDEYEQLSDFVKDNYYLIKIGDNFIKLPKGRTISVVQMATSRTIDYMKGDETAFDGMGKSAWSAISPVNDFRTIISPIDDVKYNTTWYGGTIVSSKYNSVRPNQQYDKTTSWFAKQIAKLNKDWSPLKIDYLLDSYSGVIGDILLPITSEEKKNPLVFVKSQFTVDSKYSTRYYDDFDSVMTELNYRKTEGDLHSALQYKYMSKVKSAINDLYKEQQTYDKNSMEYETAQVVINNLYKVALDRINTFGDVLDSYVITEENMDDVYKEGLFNTFGGKVALEFTDKSNYDKATALQSVGISYDNYYYIHAMTRGNGMNSIDALNFINRLNCSYDQKVLIYMSLGYSLNTNMKNKLKSILNKSKDNSLNDLIKRYLK